MGKPRGAGRADDPAGCGAQAAHTPCWALPVRQAGAAAIHPRRACAEAEARGGPGLPGGPGAGELGARTRAELSDSDSGVVPSGGTRA